MIRILHAADLHLDSPFAALRSDQAASRRQEQRDLLFTLSRVCRERNCQILLLAGDLFDSGKVFRETLDALAQALSECGAQVFLAPGNHDYYSPLSAYETLAWPDNVHIFTSREIRAIRMKDPDVTIYGAAFDAPSVPSMLHGFHADPADALSVMVIHGDISSSHSVYNQISVEDVRDSGLDYLALGHVHTDSLRRVGKTTVAIPGCAMGRGFDEIGEKGAFYVELEQGDCRVTPVCLGARQYHVRSVRVERDPLQAILEKLPPHTERDIYRIILTGECQAPDLNLLREALRGRFYALELLDHTLPPLELWSAVDEESLKGEFLRCLRAIYDNADEEKRRIAAAAAKLGLALMEGREVPEC